MDNAFMTPVQPIRIKHGFFEIIDSDTIATLTFFFNGRCIIQYADGTCNTINVDVDTYNDQFGVPVTEDGKTMFVGYWYKKKGLIAIDTDTGNVKWQSHINKVKKIYVYPGCIIAARYNNGLMKFDSETGELLASFKSSTLMFTHWLNERLLLLDSGYGRLCIVDTNSMQTVKKYNDATVNPNDCHSIAIQKVYTKNNELHICGLEAYPNGQFIDSNGNRTNADSKFDRIIDDNWTSL